MYYVIYFYFRFMCIEMFHIANDTWFIHAISTMYIILKRINFLEGFNLHSHIRLHCYKFFGILTIYWTSTMTPPSKWVWCTCHLVNFNIFLMVVIIARYVILPRKLWSWHVVESQNCHKHATNIQEKTLFLNVQVVNKLRSFLVLCKRLSFFDPNFFHFQVWKSYANW